MVNIYHRKKNKKKKQQQQEVGVTTRKDGGRESYKENGVWPCINNQAQTSQK